MIYSFNLKPKTCNLKPKFMDLTHFQQRKKQKYLILVLSGVLLASAIFIWQGFIAKEGKQLIERESQFLSQKVKINFETLKNPVLEQFQAFEKIEPFKGEAGRDNPFIPY